MSKDHWPEYYDGKHGRYVGKQARKFQTWSIAGFLVAKMMLEDHSRLCMISLEASREKIHFVDVSVPLSFYFSYLSVRFFISTVVRILRF